MFNQPHFYFSRRKDNINMAFINGYPNTEKLTREEKQTLFWAASMLAPRDPKHSESISARAAATLRAIAEKFSGPEEPAQYWVRVPGPGQFRGEGTWVKTDRVTYDSAENWLPRHEGPRPPVCLVDFLAEAAKTDTSVIRRAVVEGAVTVNSQVIEDPAHRLDETPLNALLVEYAGNGYPYYP